MLITGNSIEKVNLPNKKSFYITSIQNGNSDKAFVLGQYNRIGMIIRRGTIVSIKQLGKTLSDIMRYNDVIETSKYSDDSRSNNRTGYGNSGKYDRTHLHATKKETKRAKDIVCKLYKENKKNHVGYPMRTVAETLGVSESTCNRLHNGTLIFMRKITFNKIIEMDIKLSHADNED